MVVQQGTRMPAAGSPLRGTGGLKGSPHRHALQAQRTAAMQPPPALATALYPLLQGHLTHFWSSLSSPRTPSAPAGAMKQYTMSLTHPPRTVADNDERRPVSPTPTARHAAPSGYAVATARKERERERESSCCQS